MYLITGAAGFIGFNYALKLLKNRKMVIGIDNLNSYYNIKIKKDRLRILKKFPNFIHIYCSSVSNLPIVFFAKRILKSSLHSKPIPKIVSFWVVNVNAFSVTK